MKNAIKLLSLLLLAIQFVFAITINTFSIESLESSIVEDPIDYGRELPIISSPISVINIPTRVSFDNTDVLEYTFETDGLQATEISEGSMEFDVIATDEFGVLDVYATHSDGTVAKSSVYSYTNENNTYFSDISQDQAWYDGTQAV